MGKESLRPRDHSKKEVREALMQILAMPAGFTLAKGAHWGILHCANGCCRITVASTPANSSRAAKRLLREARKCPLPDDDPRSVAR
jgi:hypothetical protein